MDQLYVTVEVSSLGKLTLTLTATAARRHQASEESGVVGLEAKLLSLFVNGKETARSSDCRQFGWLAVFPRFAMAREIPVPCIIFLLMLLGQMREAWLHFT